MVVVYAAASLTGVLDSAAVAYRETAGIRVVVRTGASGMLAREIQNGAPADIFVSADEAWVKALQEEDRIEPGTSRVVAWNTLVVAVPRDAEMIPKSWGKALSLDRFVIADPQTAPAGKYARDALVRMALWEAIEPRCVLAYDVRAALALVERGEVAAGIVYGSDVEASERVTVAFPMPEGSYDPVVYVGAVLRGASDPERARAFLEFLSGAPGKAILRAHGFAGA